MYKINEHELAAGKDPMGLAASVLYLCMNEDRDSNVNRTQSDLAAAAGASILHCIFIIYKKKIS